MITRDTIDKIYNVLRIEDVVGDYVSLRKRGANMIGLCPFHDEKTGSFTVSPAKGIYKCFGCGKAGNAVNFVMEIEQCTYPDALRQIAKRYNIQIVETERTEEEKAADNERESMLKLNDWAKEWFEQTLFETEEGQNIGLSYFLSRGLREDTIRKFHLGYSPEKNALYKAATKAKYQDEYLLKTGLCGQSERGLYDRFRDRVIFPIFSVSGKVVGFAGRILKKKDNVGKYVNSPESIIYSKQNELYGLFQAKQAISKQGCCYLVEGQMDVLSMYQAGIQNVVCSGGTALTHNQVRLMHRFTENVTIIYDGDSAGIHAALRGIDMLLEEGLNIKVVLLPDGEDPDSFSHKMNASDFIDYIAQNQQDFIRFKTNLLLQDTKNDPLKKAEVVKSILQSIAVIPDNIKRQLYTQDCSVLLAMNEDVLLREMGKIRREYIENKRKTAENGNRNTETSAPIEAPMEPIVAPTTPASLPTIPPTPTRVERPKSKLDMNILNLLQVLIRYGDRTYIEYDDGTHCTVGEFIIEDLQSNGITFENTLYQQIVDEYTAHMHEEGFKAENYFTFHTDKLVNTLAIHLITDKYELSKIHARQSITENVTEIVDMPSLADNLQNVVVQLLDEMKLTLICELISDLRKQIQYAQDNNDYERMMPLLKELQAQEENRQAFCKILGHQ